MMIAQAYVALAEDSNSEPDVTSLKAKAEKESPSSNLYTA